MRKPLSERLESTRRLVRRVVIFYGACWILFGLVLVVTIAGLIDWMFHVSVGMRILFLGVLGITLLGLAYRHLIRPLGVRVSDLDLALRLERLYPQLGEHLSSTVGFLKLADDDPFAGSPVLRDAVIDRALAQTEELEFTGVVEARPARRIAVWAGCAISFALALIMASPLDASIALRRLANPISGPAWPQRTRLKLLETPQRVAKGDPFEVSVEVGGVVPDRVLIRYRFVDGDQPAPEQLRPTTETVFRGGLDAANRPFAFAIEAGDAHTEWYPVEVVPAPEVTELNVSVAYPAYTRMPPEDYPEGRGHVRAVIGSKVTVAARVNKPLEHAELRIDTKGSQPAIISADGLELQSEFTVEKDANYQIMLQDQQGMSNARRSPKLYRIQAVADTAPEVTLQRPTSDIEATPEATVPIKVLLKDDFGLQNAEIRYTAPPALPSADAAANPPEAVIPLFQTNEIPKRHVVDYAWNLTPLKLSNGSMVRFTVHSRDHRDVPGPNIGKSREIRIRIVTKNDLMKNLEGQQQLLREELERILKLQENALGQVAELQKQAEIVGKLQPNEIEKLQSADMLQRRVREKLSDSEQSLRNEVRRLLDMMQANKLQDVDTDKRLSLIQSELARISEQHLPPIAQSLTRAMKEAKGDSRETPPAAEKGSPTESPSGAAKAGSESKTEGAQAKESSPGKASEAKSAPAGKSAPGQAKSSPAGETKQGVSKPGETKADEARPAEAPATEPPSLAPPSSEDDNRPMAPLPADLNQAKRHQQQVVSALSQILDQLEKWETVAQVTNDARELRTRQGEVNAQTEKLAADTLGKRLEELTPEQRAAAATTAGRQSEAAEQLQRLQRKLERMAEKTAKEDETTAAMLRDAAKQAQEGNLAGKMSEASRNIQENRTGDATRRQQEITQALDNLVDSLENRREQELARLVKQLRLSERDLAQIREEQRRLLQKTKEADTLQDPKQRENELQRLRKRQEELQRKTDEFAKRLSRLRAQQASLRAGRASARMDQAGQQMRQSQGGQAGEQQQQAEQELEQAQQALARARAEAEDELAQEQLAKIADSIRQVHERELKIRAENDRLEALRQSKGRWSRGELQSVSALSRNQRGLAAEAKALTQKLTAAKVFVTVIEQAVTEMDRAAKRLEERDTGQATQRHIDGAARRFAQLLESLRPDRNQQAQQQQRNGQQGEGQGAGAGGDGIPNIAQIKLLKALQIEINERTNILVDLKAKSGGRWTADQEKEFSELSERQGQLAGLIHELVEPAEEPTEEGNP